MSEPVIDCHVHVFDPVRYPYAPDAWYVPIGPETGTVEQLRRTHDAHDVRHAVLVGPNSGYGEDNRYLLDAVGQGGGRFRGVAVVPNHMTREQLSRLRNAGIVGVTLNAALLGVEYFAGAEALLSSLSGLDMIADVQVTGDQLTALAPMIARSGVRVHVDHCGRPDPAAGLDAPGFRQLLRLGGEGRAVVKLSGLVKFSHRPPPHEDAWPLVRALVDTFGPDHCVWASDWPFLRAPVRMDYGPLLTQLEELVPDSAARREILWHTPCREFGFPS